MSEYDTEVRDSEADEHIEGHKRVNCRDLEVIDTNKCMTNLLQGSYLGCPVSSRLPGKHKNWQVQRPASHRI